MHQVSLTVKDEIVAQVNNIINQEPGLCFQLGRSGNNWKYQGNEETALEIYVLLKKLLPKKGWNLSMRYNLNR